MKRLLKYISIILVASLAACTNEIDDKFDQSAAERINEALAQYQEILESATNGWLMEYFPGDEDNMNGGYNLICNFNGDEVSILSELDPTANPEVSLYDLISDQGPVLTFNTYNKFLHIFSDPGVNPPSGYAGDYEFVFTNVTDDEIVLTGKKRRNKIVLKRLDENISHVDYLNKILAMENIILDFVMNPKFQIKENDNIVGDFFIQDNFTADVQIEGKLTTHNVIFTDIGCKLYDSITIKGKNYREFIWDVTAEQLVAKSQQGDSEIIAKGYEPEGYNTFNKFLGTYSATYLNYNAVSKSVTLTVEANGNNFLISGFGDAPYKLVMRYNKSGNGSVYFQGADYIGSISNTPIYIFGWAGINRKNNLTSSNTIRYNGSIENIGSGIKISFKSNSSSYPGIAPYLVTTGYSMLHPDLAIENLVMEKQ